MAGEAWVVVDLGFGDAGKGAVVDFLARDRAADLVVRWHGGAQAGHNVVTADGRHHTFSQLGAGTFAGVPTLLGPDFLLHPLGLWFEARALAGKGVPDPLSGLEVDGRARVVTPYHQAAGRVREHLRGAAAHGTCGVGVGACVEDSLLHPEDVLRASDLGDRARVVRRLLRQRERLHDALQGAPPSDDLAVLGDVEVAIRAADAWVEVAGRLRVVDGDIVARRVAEARVVVFEGAQGVLLDEDWGFHPHTTWSDCTPSGARRMLGERPATVLGVTRAHHVRHGAGPFPTAGTLDVPEVHNGSGGWQGAFRTGALDAVLLRYAAEVVGGVDAVAVTCLDRVGPSPLGCPAYADGTTRLDPGLSGDLARREALGAWLRNVVPVIEPRAVVPFVEDAVGAPVRLLGRGPTAADKAWR